MKRRKFLTISSIITTAALQANGRPLANLLPDFLKYEMRHLRGNVGIFTERGGTIGWLMAPKNVVIIDSQFPEQANHLLAEIQETGAPIDYLINTHHHRDHTGGNIAFKGIAKSILAHTNSKANQMRVAEERGITEKQLYPDQTFITEWSNPVDDETVTLTYHGAAHTNGDAIIHFENANVVHIGDLVFNRRHPYIDKSAGADIENWIQVLDVAIRKFDDETIFIFGHAREGYQVTGGQDDLRAFGHYLEKLLEFVGKEIKSGKSLEDMLKADGIPGADEWKGRGIERPIKAAYAELAK